MFLCVWLTYLHAILATVWPLWLVGWAGRLCSKAASWTRTGLFLVFCHVTCLLTPVAGFPLQQAEKPFAAAKYRGRNCFLLQGDKGEDLQLLTACYTCPSVPHVPPGDRKAL